MTYINNELEIDDDIDAELDDESTPEDDAVFAKAFGAELLDSRLTGNELRLYLWLKFRCRAGKQAKGLDKYDRSYKFKWSTVADDFGVDRKTVTNWSANLENLGLLYSTIVIDPETKLRKTSKKTIRAPSKIYGAERLENFVSFLKRDRTEEELSFARSEGLTPDDSIRPKKTRVVRRQEDTHGNKRSHDEAMGTNVLTVHGNKRSHGPWEQTFSPYKGGADASAYKDGTDVVNKDNLYITKSKQFRNPFGDEREEGVNIDSSLKELETTSSLSEKINSAQPDNLIPPVIESTDDPVIDPRDRDRVIMVHPQGHLVGVNKNISKSKILNGFRYATLLEYQMRIQDEKSKDEEVRLKEHKKLKDKFIDPSEVADEKIKKVSKKRTFAIANKMQKKWKDLFVGYNAGMTYVEWKTWQATQVVSLADSYGENKILNSIEYMISNWSQFCNNIPDYKFNKDKYIVPTIEVFLKYTNIIIALVDRNKNNGTHVPNEFGW